MPELKTEDRARVRADVQTMISDVLTRKRAPKPAEQIVEGLSLTRDLGIDSLDILQLTAQLEKRYKLRIPEADIKKLDDLGGIMTAIERNWPGS